MSLKIVEVEPTVYFKKEHEDLVQAVDFTIFSEHPLNELILETSYNNVTFSRKINYIKAGEQKLRLFIPDIREKLTINFSLKVNGKSKYVKKVNWLPQKHWEVYVSHGSHHDLGYTDLPDRILEEHKGYIEKAIEYCELTENFPEESKFHYVFEEAWSVLYFLEHSSDELREKLIHYLQNGQFELTGLFGNQITDISGFEELNRLIYPVHKLKNKYNLPVYTAEINDIPGIHWGIVPVLTGSGIRYLFAGIQDYFAWGDEAAPVPWSEEKVMKRDHISAFYWKGPSQDSVMVWYNGGSIGNFWLWDPVQGEAELNKYLLKEEKKDYPWNMIFTRVLGGLRDNSLPDMRLSEIIKLLNEKWEYPRLIFATNTDFFMNFERKHGRELKTLTGDFNQTDYNIGTLSTPKETGINRINQNLVLTAETFSTIASALTALPYRRNEINEAYERILLFDEHCWGMANPSGPAQKAAESQKRHHSYQASALIHDLMVKSMNNIADQISLKNEGIHIVVFNPLNYERSDIVELQAYPDVPIGKPFYREKRQMGDHIYYVNRSGEAHGRKQISIPTSFLEKPFQIVDVSTGEIIDHQIRIIDDPLMPIPNASDRYALGQINKMPQAELNNQMVDILFFARNIPSLGYKVYRLIPSDNKKETAESNLTTKDGKIENDFYTIEYDEHNGFISIYDKELEKELISNDKDLKFGQVFFRHVQSEEIIHPRIYEVKLKEHGPVYSSIYLKSKDLNCPVINQEMIVYHQQKKIDISARIIKNPVPFYEIYLGFPFRLDNPRFKIGMVNALLDPIEDQLPGTVSDYYAMQQASAVYNQSSSIIFSSREAPIIKLSDIWPGYVSQAHHGLQPVNYIHDFPDKFENSHIYSFVSANNFRTNFSSIYTGDMLFRYSFTSHEGSFDPSKMNIFGWQTTHPLFPVILNGPVEGKLKDIHSFFETDNNDIRLYTIKAAEDGNGMILRLAETSGSACTAKFQIRLDQIMEIYKTDIAENNLELLNVKDNQISIKFDPFETVTIRLISDKVFKTSDRYFYSY